ncbi:hypothetical protein FDUTEX481_01384 [Tolypothrix sp. PCC 7601]|nr:hypothetical protein FDUTEX481_01384 [Tolypothrix sp. PCC 7601]
MVRKGYNSALLDKNINFELLNLGVSVLNEKLQVRSLNFAVVSDNVLV